LASYAEELAVWDWQLAQMIAGLLAGVEAYNALLVCAGAVVLWMLALGLIAAIWPGDDIRE
jgi:hypothetical protein